jgi:hypothetical protein
VFLWCVIRGIFVGGLQDYGALFAAAMAVLALILTAEGVVTFRKQRPATRDQ